MNGSAGSWNERKAFAGFDWASDHHDIVVVDAQGALLDQFRIEDTAEDWERFRQRLEKHPSLAIAIETSCGAAVERLVEAGCAVFPVNPKAAKRYRERKVPSGTKTDFIDAWSLADALRVDGQAWRPLKPDDPLTVELRLLCRDEISLIEQRTALVCQLRAALHEYYPAALRAFEEWTTRAAWAFVARFPTPQALAKAGKRQWEKFLHVHKLYHSKERYAERLNVFAAAEQFCGSTLRSTVHLWANLSRTRCIWAEAYYRSQRERGRSHACALRCLGQRWLKILWKMWHSRTSYDADLHQRNQVMHGSWVIGLVPTGQCMTNSSVK